MRRDPVSLVPRHGLALCYRNAQEYEALGGRQFALDGAVFAGFRVNRRGDSNSDGFEGELPFGIEYHHTPEQAVSRVGRKPDSMLVNDDVAAYVWRFEACSMHLLISLIDYQIYRVTCFAEFMESELFR
ncbi:hypothetical protein VAPA_2c03240 [Variovorax paradoxus B4]|uniref:Uncharacterized protein n=1 Tax=Variovorax paradoxus B4 TaxID=1246301 RepID=T1XL66_VARPD|nr:hypothetical protein VAPA_2c03240 [Variovorax paradoxus B4]